MAALPACSDLAAPSSCAPCLFSAENTYLEYPYHVVPITVDIVPYVWQLSNGTNTTYARLKFTMTDTSAKLPSSRSGTSRVSLKQPLRLRPYIIRGIHQCGRSMALHCKSCRCLLVSKIVPLMLWLKDIWYFICLLHKLCG